MGINRFDRRYRALSGEEPLLRLHDAMRQNGEETPWLTGSQFTILLENGEASAFRLTLRTSV